MKKVTKILSALVVLTFCQTNLLTMEAWNKFQEGKISKKEYYQQAPIFKAIVVKKYKSGPRRGKFKVMLLNGKKVRCFINPTSSLKVKNLKAGNIVGIKISPTDDKEGRMYKKFRESFI